MTDSGLLAGRLAARRGPAADDDADAGDDCGAFSCLRGAHARALMVDFRLLSGNRDAFPYAALDRVTYDPSLGLTLCFLGVRVVLRGRNFAAAQATGPSLLDALHRHRVPWVRETEELRAGLTPPDAVVVTKIEILDG